MPRLDLFLLGSPRAERDGTPIQVDTRKATALLAYLAVTGQSHSRDALATLLWPEYDQTHAHAALRRTLSVLNKAVAGDWLQIERETVGLDPSAGVWLDVEQFHSRLADCLSHSHSTDNVCPGCLAPLGEAAALYRDDFLAGFTLRDSSNFDDWQFFQAESLRRELAGALERLVRCHGERREFEQAITYARRWLTLDSLHESAHRRLMQLYAGSGQRAAALRQYRECVRVLEQELGVAPLEETTQLYEAIRQQGGRGADSEGQGAGGKAHTAGEQGREVAGISTDSQHPRFPAYPLVGRAAEWQKLLHIYDAIGSGQPSAVGGHLVVLEGEAGIGKTRLAEAFLDYMRQRGAAVVMARCYQGETNLTYAPIADGLRAVIGNANASARLSQLQPQWLSETARLLPELATIVPHLPPAPPLDGPGAQSRFLEGISQAILAMCGGPPPGVLFLDDLHWADEASLDLLAYLVRRLRGRPLLVLAAWRGEHVASIHRLRAMLADAERAGLGTGVPLSRLSRPAVIELAQIALPLGNQPAAGVGERLYRETEGLPFFLVEYLGAIAQGAELGPALPGGVRDLLRSRLAAIDETGRQLLGAAAVIGRSFDLATLQQTSGRGDEETVNSLESLMAHGLVLEVTGAPAVGRPPSETYDFGHEKLRALVYEEISLARRRLLHARVAEALAGRARSRRPLGPLAGQIAEHYRLAGREPEAAEYFKMAGEHARALFANTEALAHFHSALALGHSDTAGLHEAIGDLHTLSGNYVAALTSYETAAAMGSSDSLAGLEHKLGNVYHRRGEWELADRHFQAALNALGEAPNRDDLSRYYDQGAGLYADWSLTAHRRGHTDHALDLAHRALEAAEAANDKRALAQAHNILGILASSRRDLAAARHNLERSLALADELGDAAARAAALNNLALACRADGAIEQALGMAERALALVASLGDRHREAALHSNLADLLHAAGRSDAAMAHLKQAVAIFADIGQDAGAGAWQPEIWKLTEW